MSCVDREYQAISNAPDSLELKAGEIHTFNIPNALVEDSNGHSWSTVCGYADVTY